MGVKNYFLNDNLERAFLCAQGVHNLGKEPKSLKFESINLRVEESIKILQH